MDAKTRREKMEHNKKNVSCLLYMGSQIINGHANYYRFSVGNKFMFCKYNLFASIYLAPDAFKV